MLITVHKQTKTKLTETYLVEYGKTVKRMAIRRNRKRDTLDTLRYVINRAVGPNTGVLRHLANRRVSGGWVSEWMIQ